MNVKRFSLMTGVLAVWAGACMAGSSGVIQFHGSVVEPSCHAASPGGSTLELKGCRRPCVAAISRCGRCAR